ATRPGTDTALRNGRSDPPWPPAREHLLNWTRQARGVGEQPADAALQLCTCIPGPDAGCDRVGHDAQRKPRARRGAGGGGPLSPYLRGRGYSAARFGVNSSGNPLWPVSLSPSTYISKARFFNAGRTAAILSRSRSAAIPGYPARSIIAP